MILRSKCELKRICVLERSKKPHGGRFVNEETLHCVLLSSVLCLHRNLLQVNINGIAIVLGL